MRTPGNRDIDELKSELEDLMDDLEITKDILRGMGEREHGRFGDSNRARLEGIKAQIAAVKGEMEALSDGGDGDMTGGRKIPTRSRGWPPRGPSR